MGGNAHLFKKVHGGFIEGGSELFRGGVSGTETRTIPEDFESQPAVHVDFQHVNRHVRRVQADNPFERLAPGYLGLKRKPGYEVDIDIHDAGGSQGFDIGYNRGGAMLPSGLTEFTLHKRLHSETDAVHSRITPEAGLRSRDRTGSGFDSAFGPRAAG